MRVVRRVHGFLSHRRADQSAGGADGARRRRAGGRRRAEGAAVFRESFRHVPGAEPERGGAADFKKGDIVCREGEYGSTAFYIVSGVAQVYIATPIAHVQNRGGVSGFISKLRSRLTGRGQDRRDGESTQQSIPIDAPVDLPYDKPIAELAPGDLFGEMTCMSLYPRSATVQAATDCVMYEMLRNVLDIIQRNKTLKTKLDDRYRRRALEDHLKSVPLFAPLTDEFIESLRDLVELVRFNKGDVICRQGDIADAFYLVRIGFVKVAEEHPEGELVLAYLGRGGYFGEIGLLDRSPRNATCTALDHVEVVRIKDDRFPADDGQRSLKSGRGWKWRRGRRSEQNRQRAVGAAKVPLDQFLAQGLMEAQSLLLLDLEKCTRCDQCVRACADAHDGVTRLIREGLRFDKYLVATSCRQCRDPLCMVGCPVGSIRRRNSLEVIIEDWCIGCGLCAKNCPYGNINLHPFRCGRSARAAARWFARRRLPATCAPSTRSRVACTPARMTRRIAWTRTCSSDRW